MGSNFHVVLDDLHDAARSFTREGDDASDEWAAQIPTAQTGDPVCDNVLETLVLSFGKIGLGLAASLHDHGSKLKEVAESYHSTDADSAQLFDRLMEQLE